MIRLEHINKTFNSSKKEVHAVRDVSLHIEKGDIYGIIGFSGAGKSTLVRCINLLERPTSGKVIVSGQDLMELKAKDLREARRKIGMIFQQFNLMPSRTISENVAFPLVHRGLSKSEIAQKVENLLELVDIGDKKNAYPNQLSGGQKQRVAIARALANDPDILLCDEATSALDPQTTKSILQLLKKVNETLGITIVIITHEMAVVKDICNKVAVMENGQVVEQGEVFSIFAKPQQNITKSFIESTSNLQKIWDLMEENSKVTQLNENQVILRLSYIEQSPSQPIISEIASRFGVTFNIVFADIEIVQDAPIGGTIAILDGSKENLDKAINYIKEKNVGVEVLKDGRLS